MNKIYTLDEAMSLTSDEARKLSETYMNTLRIKSIHPKLFVKAKGNKLYDEDGCVYLDMASSIGVDAVGNNNDLVKEALIKVLNSGIPCFQQSALHPVTAAFAHNLAMLSPGSLNRLWTGTGGSEAVEAVLKMVNLACRKKPKKQRMISCENSFHGKTLGSLSLTGRDAWKIYNNSIIKNIDFIPFNDIDSLEQELSKGDVIAFFVEPIQGEGGIIIPDDNYLPEVRRLCSEYDTYLICDEIQTGFGRTGKLWAFENWNIIPDACTWAKGFSGGYVPHSGVLASEELWNAAYGSEDTFFLHTNTFMEGTLASAASLEALEYITKWNLMERNREKGELLLNGLQTLKGKFPEFIQDVRGKGLLLAMDLHSMITKVPDNVEEFERSGFFTSFITEELLHQHHILVRQAGIKPRIRFLPTYDISDEDINYFLKSFEDALISCKETFHI